MKDLPFRRSGLDLALYSHRVLGGPLFLSRYSLSILNEMGVQHQAIGLNLLIEPWPNHLGHGAFLAIGPPALAGLLTGKQVCRSSFPPLSGMAVGMTSVSLSEVERLIPCIGNVAFGFIGDTSFPGT
jgi:hypothetical protein